MLEPMFISNSTDIQFFYLINVNMQNPIFDFIMPLMSEIGYFIFWVVISIIIFIFGGERERNASLVCITALIGGFFITDFLKLVVAVPRPYEVLEGVRVLVSINGYSWPSGHSVASFIALTVYGLTIIRKKSVFIYFFIFVVIIMFSRVYNGVHYPSDVISGALIGIFIALVFLRYENDIIKLKNKLMNK